MTDGPSTWITTTHDWTEPVDVEHLADIRARSAEFGGGGVRHLVLEVLAYADDEARALGRRGTATVTLRDAGSITVSDDGRGTDTRRDDAGHIVRKPVMATRDVRFFDAAAPPLLPDGAPRRGMSTVAALSEVLVHENRRGTEGWTQAYHHGRPATDLGLLDDPSSTGTSVTFTPDRCVPKDVGLEAADLSAFEWLEISVVDGRSNRG